MSDAPVQVFGFGGSLWGLPSASPFVNKLILWLRMAGIPHTLGEPKGPPASKTGKVPYILRPDGSVLSDSSVIIATLGAERGIELGAPFGSAEQAKLTAIQRLCEDSLYWTIVYFRWIDPAGWAITQPAYFGFIPAAVRWAVTPFIRGQVRRSLHGQGLGRRSPAEIAAVGIADVDALVGLLGEQEYLLGRPTVADAIAWGMLAGFFGTPYADPVTLHARAQPALAAYVARLGQRFPAP